jgi:hypothetical protein
MVEKNHLLYDGLLGLTFSPIFKASDFSTSSKSPQIFITLYVTQENMECDDFFHFEYF